MESSMIAGLYAPTPRTPRENAAGFNTLWLNSSQGSTPLTTSQRIAPHESSAAALRITDSPFAPFSQLLATIPGPPQLLMSTPQSPDGRVSGGGVQGSMTTSSVELLTDKSLRQKCLGEHDAAVLKEQFRAEAARAQPFSDALQVSLCSNSNAASSVSFFDVLSGTAASMCSELWNDPFFSPTVTQVLESLYTVPPTVGTQDHDMLYDSPRLSVKKPITQPSVSTFDNTLASNEDDLGLWNSLHTTPQDTSSSSSTIASISSRAEDTSNAGNVPPTTSTQTAPLLPWASMPLPFTTLPHAVAGVSLTEASQRSAAPAAERDWLYLLNSKSPQPPAASVHPEYPCSALCSTKASQLADTVTHRNLAQQTMTRSVVHQENLLTRIGTYQDKAGTEKTLWTSDEQNTGSMGSAVCSPPVSLHTMDSCVGCCSSPAESTLLLCAPARPAHKNSASVSATWSEGSWNQQSMGRAEQRDALREMSDQRLCVSPGFNWSSTSKSDGVEATASFLGSELCTTLYNNCDTDAAAWAFRHRDELCQTPLPLASPLRARSSPQRRSLNGGTQRHLLYKPKAASPLRTFDNIGAAKECNCVPEYDAQLASVHDGGKCCSRAPPAIVLAHPDEFKNPSSFLKVYGDPLCTKVARQDENRPVLPGENGNWECVRCRNVNYPRRLRCNKCNEIRGAEGDALVAKYVLTVYEQHLKTARYHKATAVLGKGRRNDTTRRSVHVLGQRPTLVEDHCVKTPYREHCFLPCTPAVRHEAFSLS